MTERERAERAAFDAMIREKIASGAMTPDEAEDEWYYHFNGCDSRQNTCGL